MIFRFVFQRSKPANRSHSNPGQGYFNSPGWSPPGLPCWQGLLLLPHNVRAGTAGFQIFSPPFKGRFPEHHSRGDVFGTKKRNQFSGEFSGSLYFWDDKSAHLFAECSFLWHVLYSWMSPIRNNLFWMGVVESGIMMHNVLTKHSKWLQKSGQNDLKELPQLKFIQVFQPGSILSKKQRNAAVSRRKRWRGAQRFPWASSRKTVRRWPKQKIRPQMAAKWGWNSPIFGSRPVATRQQHKKWVC